MINNYFKYLGSSPDPAAIKKRLGSELDKLMTLDVNLAGRAEHLYALAARGASGPLSTGLGERLLDVVRPADVICLVTGCSVRPQIDVAIGEPDGPAGVAALARALYLTRQALSVVVTSECLLPQAAAALRAAGATLIGRDRIADMRKRRPNLFGAVLVGYPVDQDVDGEFETLLNATDPRAVIAVEHFGYAADGKAYLTAGRTVEGGLLRSAPLFAMAAERSLLRACCVDNPNEAGTARLHSSAARHPAMADDFEHVVVAASANAAAYAVAAAIAGLAGAPDAAFTRELDEMVVAAVLRNGAIDPFSGLSDPALGTDTMERPYHGYVTDLMARTARGYCIAAAMVQEKI
ncbi:glutamate cyclase domain-containing protein [Phreatobacter sp. AB_2022a]|uniref:glutamate cyclase domain-containing protein n=1 Tax=Phreatobacter sp. AB_2022a TaxID=3003134 RepID=UPI002286E4F8|nr:glutamate cyclase domain-containing protein [Phreatobacter sp. AB_2022a]MCZ0736891.1 DUF4392 domain-containing protein [Phreatobacter sp. AB_2022a]